VSELHTSVTLSNRRNSVQREFLPRTIVDVACVGNRSEGLLQFANYNQARPNAAGESVALQARRPITSFGDITSAWNGGRSASHDFQLETETRTPAPTRSAPSLLRTTHVRCNSESD
jgi:hypothetical protein